MQPQNTSPDFCLILVNQFTLKVSHSELFQSKMQSMDVLELLKKPEGKTLEFKRDLSSPGGILRVLVAFANTAGGTLIIGVEDGYQPPQYLGCINRF